MSLKVSVAVILCGFLSLFVSACAHNVALVPGAERVTVGKNDPTDNFSDVGQVTGFDGRGCGGFGYRGIYERAVLDIKNKAFQLGADYVQIFTITEPHYRPGCFDNLYKISGTAYKKVRKAPSPLPISTPGNAAQGKTLSEQLRELQQLRQEGLLSEEEYQNQRRKVLGK